MYRVIRCSALLLAAACGSSQQAVEPTGSTATAAEPATRAATTAPAASPLRVDPMLDAEATTGTLTGYAPNEPVASLDEHCELSKDMFEELSDYTCSWSADDSLPAARPPFDEIVMVSITDGADTFDQIAVRIGDQWWVLATLRSQSQGEGDGASSTTLLGASFQDVVPGDPLEIVVQVAEMVTSSLYGDDGTATGAQSSAWKKLTICGVAPSGAPSCIEADYAQADDGGGVEEQAYDVELDVAFDGQGRLHTSLRAGRSLRASTLAPGVFVLVFE